MALAACLFVPTGPSWAAFPGSGVGAIPDGSGGCGGTYGTPLDVTFSVTGLTSPVADVDIAIDFAHTWIGDVDAVVVAPNNDTHVLFSRTGAITAGGCGESSDANGAYTFRDEASGTNWWDEAASNNPLDPGDYKTTEPGGAGQSDPAPETLLFEAFSGLPAAIANGTWTLRLRDGSPGDTGSVTAASLAINQDCLSLVLVNDTVTDTQDWAACYVIELGLNFAVMGPGGNLTVTAGAAVILSDGFHVGIDGTFTAANDSGLSPLDAALEESRLMGEAAGKEAGSAESDLDQIPSEVNPDKVRALGLIP